MTMEKRPLKAFLCHASGDKPLVRDLYKRLTIEGVDAWLDQEKLLPGQDWRLEIPKAVQEADVVVVCLSKRSITKEGYVQKEIKFALDIAEEKPEGTIFLIPARLEDCVVPERLNRWQWVDLYEDNGFIMLLRSLKLRADAVDATVEPTLYIDSDKETDRRLEQLYTEGLAAFYTENWDKACQRFQAILSERPNHKQASEKLEAAKRQRDIANLYQQATAAVQNADWKAAIQILEALYQKSANYRDVAELLKNARKQKQLNELYSEAKALHAAQKWEAVVRVFEQISSIDPNYPDADKLFPSAQQEVAELKRIIDLNNQYSRALREMDAGNWYEARRGLETIHKSETGFKETEKLLKKVDAEIVQEEEKRKQNDEINTLYEQAHGLLRSKKWRNALDKMDQIHKLDEHFPDTDRIAEKAQKELVREEQEAERQNKLAALYTEAVKFFKEEKYQEALDKWGEVKAIDPRYPDRQRVGRTAKKALTKQVKPISTKPRFLMPKSLRRGLGVTAIVATVIFSVNILINIYFDPTMYDDFDNTVYDGSIDVSLWGYPGDISSLGDVYQNDGTLVFKVNGYEKNLGIFTQTDFNPITTPMFIEARMMLDPDTTKWADFGITFVAEDAASVCSIFAAQDSQEINCWSYSFGNDHERYKVEIIPGTWHILRIEVYPETMQFSYIVDGKEIGVYVPQNREPLRSFEYVNIARLNNWGTTAKNPIGYIDYFRMGTIKDDPNAK